MAQRRMFSVKITNSAKFLKMPIDSQLLYFHLGLHADDDGVVEAYTIIKTLNSNEDNLKVLVAKGFIKILNEDLVSYITDWNEHNLIRADRKVDSIYKNLLLQIVSDIDILEPKPRSDTGKLTGRPLDNQWTAQVRLGKDRIDNKELVLPNWLDVSRWNEWLEYRKSRKLTLSKVTLTKQLKFLEENKINHKDIIEQSIRNGWQGLFINKNGKEQIKSSKQYTIQDIKTGGVSTKRFSSEEEAKRFILLNRDWDNIRHLLQIIEAK